MTLNHGSRVLLQVQDGNCNLKVSSNLEKFPFLKCASGNRALNFLRNFWDISESFLETVRVGTFLVFSRKFPRKCVSRYVPPFSEQGFPYIDNTILLCSNYST